jgi:hypothetical protein
MFLKNHQQFSLGLLLGNSVQNEPYISGGAVPLKPYFLLLPIPTFRKVTQNASLVFPCQ